MSSKSAELQEITEELQWIALKEKKATTFFEKAKEKTGGNPLIPIGCLVTAGILGSGLRHLLKRDSVKQQKMMRWRVVAQGVTIAITAVSMFYAGKFN